MLDNDKYEILVKRLKRDEKKLKEILSFNLLPEHEQKILLLETNKETLIEIIEELQVDHDYLKSLLMFINNEAVGFIESGPYCENEPEIILETMKNIERLSFVGEE